MKTKKTILLQLALCLLLICCKKPTDSRDNLDAPDGKTTSNALTNKPNVLFIVVDDLRYWSIKRLFEQAGMEPADPGFGNRGLGNNTIPQTPNIDALIDGGNAVTFTNAHATAVECCPSRTSFLFGRYPHQSGVYRNGNNWTTGAGIDAENALTRQFVKDSKYRVFGAGKIFHVDPNKPEGKYFNPIGSSAPYNNFHKSDFDIGSTGYTPGSPANPATGYNYNIVNLDSPQKEFSLNMNNNITEDAKVVTFCINNMQNVIDDNAGLPAAQQKSFFVACGIRRPHSPLIVPQHIFNNTNSPVTPQNLPANISNLPQRAQDLINDNPAISPQQLMQSNPSQWDNYIKAYAGAVTYMDEQVGRLIDFIETSGVKSNTIIVLISDHGVHLGDKNHIHKTTLYEETTRVPMIWRVPGQGTGNSKFCDVPVDLMAVYPTLMDYCTMDPPSSVNGRDIRDLITTPGTQPDPSLTGKDLALTVMDEKSASIRFTNYRFTQYNDGGTGGTQANKEELYNHTGTEYSFDPWEARDLRSVSPTPSFLVPLRNKLNVRTQSWEPERI